MRLSAQDADNPGNFSADTHSTFDVRWDARTTARVDWDDAGSWVTDAEYNSPDIKTVIQEIVNRIGWASGNAIVIFWNDFEGRSVSGGQDWRGGYPYNISNSKAVKLVIVYTPITFIPKIMMF